MHLFKFFSQSLTTFYTFVWSVYFCNFKAYFFFFNKCLEFQIQSRMIKVCIFMNIEKEYWLFHYTVDYSEFLFCGWIAAFLLIFFTQCSIYITIHSRTLIRFWSNLVRIDEREDVVMSLGGGGTRSLPLISGAIEPAVPSIKFAKPAK